MPYSKIYEVLNRLEKRGLIQFRHGRPQLFKALPVESGLEKLERTLEITLGKKFPENKRNLENEFKRRAAHITQSKKSASKMLLSSLRPGKGRALERVNDGSEDDVIWTVSGRDNAIEQTRILIQSARCEALILLPDDGFLISSGKFPMSQGGVSVSK